MRHSLVPAAFTLWLAACPLPAARGPTGGAQPEPPPESPRLAALAREPPDGGPGALERFWGEVKGKLPLVEPAPGGGAPLVTFLWRGGKDTRRVDLVGGMPLGRPKTLSRLGD